MRSVTAHGDKREGTFALGHFQSKPVVLRAGAYNTLLIAALIWGLVSALSIRAVGFGAPLAAAFGFLMACLPLTAYSRLALAIKLDADSLSCVLPTTIWNLPIDRIGMVRLHEWPWWSWMLLVVRGKSGQLLGFCIIGVSVTKYGAMSATAKAFRAVAEQLGIGTDQ